MSGWLGWLGWARMEWHRMLQVGSEGVNRTFSEGINSVRARLIKMPRVTRRHICQLSQKNKRSCRY